MFHDAVYSEHWLAKRCDDKLKKGWRKLNGVHTLIENCVELLLFLHG